MPDHDHDVPHVPYCQHPHQPHVNRARRALFAFLITLTAMALIMVLATLKFPVGPDATTTAIHVLGDIGTFIGIGYIGGSVVDYSGMFTALGNRFGVSIPFLPAAAPAQPQAASPDVEGQ